jgi:hypothetical protein
MLTWMSSVSAGKVFGRPIFLRAVCAMPAPFLPGEWTHKKP